MINFLGDIDLGNGNKTDDDAKHSNVIMIKARISIVPPFDILKVRTHYDYCNTNLFNNSVYANFDGGVTYV